LLTHTTTTSSSSNGGGDGGGGVCVAAAETVEITYGHGRLRVTRATRGCSCLANSRYVLLYLRGYLSNFESHRENKEVNCICPTKFSIFVSAAVPDESVVFGFQDNWIAFY